MFWSTLRKYFPNSYLLNCFYPFLITSIVIYVRLDGLTYYNNGGYLKLKLTCTSRIAGGLSILKQTIKPHVITRINNMRFLIYSLFIVLAVSNNFLFTSFSYSFTICLNLLLKSTAFLTLSLTNTDIKGLVI